MINFKSKNIAIKNADRITRAANSIYPHISESKNRKKISHFQTINFPNEICYKLSNLGWKNTVKIDKLRYRSGEGIDLFRNIIDMLKNNRIGNCYEESILAQIIGKINGINNIYPSKIFFNRNSSGCQSQLDHVVAIITDKPFKNGYKYNLKKKDAIVIDTWLGITEYIGDYIRRIKTDFIELFPGIPDYEYSRKNIVRMSDNIDQFKQKRKKIFKPDFSFMLHDEGVITDEYVKKLKEEYPELILK